MSCGSRRRLGSPYRPGRSDCYQGQESSRDIAGALGPKRFGREGRLVVKVRCMRCRHTSFLSDWDLIEVGVAEMPRLRLRKAPPVHQMRQWQCHGQPRRQNRSRATITRREDCLFRQGERVFSDGVALCPIYSKMPSAPTMAIARPRSYSKPWHRIGRCRSVLLPEGLAD